MPKIIKNILEEQSQQIEDCMNRESQMSDWERGFIQSIQEQREAGRFLSDKQVSRLDIIWEKLTA
ncbi:MAG: hypothetical protein ACD_86C00003G0016 [uncultured bacterium]|nr:MAG: hypothetical protein ACD_86C00003G0016 [uncultured bacterium]